MMDTAREFGVAPYTVSLIQNGHTWQHATGASPVYLGVRRGEKNGRAKLNADEVVEIYTAERHLMIAASAALHGVSDVSVSYIRLGRTWRQVTGRL